MIYGAISTYESQGLNMAALLLEQGRKDLADVLDARRREVSVNVVKKLCDGLDIPLGQFFSAPAFDEPEQGIQCVRSGVVSHLYLTWEWRARAHAIIDFM